MALIIEDYENVVNKKIPIPQKTKEFFKALKNIYKPYLDKHPNYKILKSLGSDKKYNKKGEESNNNGEEIKQDYVTVNDAKVRLHRMNKLPKNGLEYQLNGGDIAAQLYRDGIQRSHANKEVEKVMPPKPTSNAQLKPSDNSVKTIKTPNGTIRYNESKKNVYVTEEQILKLKNDYINN